MVELQNRFQLLSPRRLVPGESRGEHHRIYDQTQLPEEFSGCQRAEALHSRVLTAFGQTTQQAQGATGQSCFTFASSGLLPSDCLRAQRCTCQKNSFGFCAFKQAFLGGPTLTQPKLTPPELPLLLSDRSVFFIADIPSKCIVTL